MYSLKLLPSAQRDLDSLDLAILRRLKPKILTLESIPIPVGAIKLTALEGYRVRMGEYRILYRVDHRARTVYLYRIKHRREAYR